MSQIYLRMTPFSIALALSLVAQGSVVPSKGGWLQTGRLIDSQVLHLGVRPAAFYSSEETDVGVTVQVSLKVF